MEDCASLPKTNVINFSNILLHAANHFLAENEADDFIEPDVQHFFHAYYFFFFFIERQ